MNGSGFDWLQVTSRNGSGTASPAPQVSFGGSGTDGNDSPVSETNKNGSPYNNGVPNLPFQSELPSTSYVGNNSNTNGLSPHYNSSSMLNMHTSNPSDTSLSVPSLNPTSISNSNLTINNINNRSHAASFSTSPSRAQNYFPHDQSSNNSDGDSGIPLSLQTQELTFQESKTYMRWYSDILARTNARTISMNDVYSFLSNFKIRESTKEKINRIYSQKLNSINIGEFFALLRLISHSLTGAEPSRKLIKMQAPTPTPPSILSKKRHTEDEDHHDSDNHEDEDQSSLNGTNGQPPGTSTSSSSLSSSQQQQLDIDSFTQFMLTGERPGEKHRKKRSKKAKSVKFSDQIVTDVHDAEILGANLMSPSPQPNQDIDYSLPMDQLLGKIKQAQSVEEGEILKDMESQINHFQNLNTVDKPASGYFEDNGHNGDNYQLLRPNMTGPAQMSRLFSPSPEPQQQNEEFLKPNMTGPAQMAKLQPNRTGPADMARLFSPDTDNTGAPESVPMISLQSFTNQMTGNTFSNTLQNSRTSQTGSPMSSPIYSNDSANNYTSNNGSEYYPPASSSVNNLNRPLPPPPVPQNRRSRSLTSPTPSTTTPIANYGETNSLHVPPGGRIGAPPAVPARIVSSPINGTGKSQPPPPPPSRRRNASIPSTTSPPPLPPKVNFHQQDQQNVVSNGTSIYGNTEGSDSTANLLTDLKALQDEVDKIRNMTGGF